MDNTTPVAVTKAYDFVLWLLPKVESFPKAYKFTVGDHLTANGMELLSLLVEAAFSPPSRKEDLLQRANMKVNVARYQLRLAKDLKLMAANSYAFSAEKLDEIGRMVGGWKKQGAARS